MPGPAPAAAAAGILSGAAHRTMSHPLRPAPAALAALALALPAQAPPAWTIATNPAGVNPPDVVGVGKLTAWRDGSVLRVHSASTRRWHSLAIGPGAVLRITNDCLVVQDGATWHGFASHRGRFEPLPVSAQAQLLNPLGNNNDSLLLVRDGSLLHAFSGFTGTWVTRPVSSAFGWSVQRHVALIADGVLLSGLDAYSGQWHDLTVATPPITLSTDGTAGLAIGPTEIHGFSANTASWRSAPAVPGAATARNDDWMLWYDQHQMLAYSGTQGRFEQAPVGAAAVVANEDDFALVDTVFGLVAWSAIRGAFSAPIAPAGARVRANVAVATIAEAGAVHGYSAARNTFATLPLPSSAEDAAGSVAYALDAGTGLPWCYSALTGLWCAPPADVLPGPPAITTTMALLPTTSGVRAFSARSGATVPLAAAGLTLLGNATSALGGAWNATDFFAFDARTGRWQSLPRASPSPPVVQIWRTAMSVIDGQVVAGFGAQDGRWSTAVLPEPMVAIRTNSEGSRIVTASHVLAHAAVAELTCAAQFPEFRRVFAAGGTARFYLPLGSGDLAVFAGGLFAPAPIAVPGFGALLLDPATLAALFVLPDPSGSTVEILLPVPASAGLLGSEWAFQALVAPAGGAPWLSGAATLLVL